MSDKRSLSGVAGTYNEGQHDVQTVDHTVVVADGGKGQQGGIVAVDYIAPNAVMKGKRQGGISVAMRDQTAEQAERIIRAAKGSRIRIKIFGDDLEDVFEQDFTPEKTIYEIIRKLKKTEKRPAGEKLVLKQKKKNQEDVILEDESTVGELGKDGDTVILWAEFPGSK